MCHSKQIAADLKKFKCPTKPVPGVFVTATVDMITWNIIYLFPKLKLQDDRDSNTLLCTQWIKACNRPHADLSMNLINRYRFICSKVGINNLNIMYMYSKKFYFYMKANDLY